MPRGQYIAADALSASATGAAPAGYRRACAQAQEREHEHACDQLIGLHQAARCIKIGALEIKGKAATLARAGASALCEQADNASNVASVATTRLRQRGTLPMSDTADISAHASLDFDGFVGAHGRTRTVAVVTLVSALRSGLNERRSSELQ